MSSVVGLTSRLTRRPLARFRFHGQGQLGIHISAVVARTMRQLSAPALRTANIVNRLKCVMRTPLALARFADPLNRLHDKTPGDTRRCTRPSDSDESTALIKKQRRGLPAALLGTVRYGLAANLSRTGESHSRRIACSQIWFRQSLDTHETRRTPNF